MASSIKIIPKDGGLWYWQRSSTSGVVEDTSQDYNDFEQCKAEAEMLNDDVQNFEILQVPDTIE